MDNETVTRRELAQRLLGRGAHMPFDEAIADFPMDRINDRFPNGTYSTWALLEHLRLAQRDILDYCVDPDYRPMDWPKDYWPAGDTVATAEDWARTVEGFQFDARALIDLVESPETDLYAPIPWGGEHTIMREILVVTDHNAYHIGELAIMRQVMGTWPADRG